MNSFELKYDFDLDKTMKSGQSFRWKQNNNIFTIDDNNKTINIMQNKNMLIFDISIEEFSEHWINYFDLNTNYNNINKYIINNYPELEQIVNFSSGIHILNQSFLETYISFIISQQNNIKRIESSIDKLCKDFSINNQFPDIEVLKKLTIDDFHNLGVGYRDKYLVDAIEKYDFIVDNLSYENLLSVNGIGDKVASCIMLFASKDKDFFPIDTHIKKALESLYFNKQEQSINKLKEFVNNKFPENKGYIQQYIFYYQLSK